LPDALKILCSIADEDGKITESSATRIKYNDVETNKTRRSFSCQFHRELLSYLLGIGKSEAPSYSTLKIDDMVSAYLSNYSIAILASVSITG
jgi:hypothetical protein